MQATPRTAEFHASSAPARAGFLALAVVISLTLLAGVGRVADRQYDAAQLAQAASATLAAQQLPASHG